MPKYSGVDGVIKFGSAPVVLGNLRGFAIEQAANALDSSVIDGSNERGVFPGQKSWSGSVEFMYDPADAGHQEVVNGTLVDIECFPTGATAGYKLSGEVLITGISLPIELDGMIVQSASFEGNGTLTNAVIP